MHGRGMCGRGACMVGGACMAGGMHGKGRAWQEGMHGMVGCMVGGHAWQGACIADTMKYGQ